MYPKCRFRRNLAAVHAPTGGVGAAHAIRPDRGQMRRKTPSPGALCGTMVAHFRDRDPLRAPRPGRLGHRAQHLLRVPITL
jgi:hypothetical protein